MHFGEKLLALRRQKGMSQEALAAELGVSRQAVSKWELGDAMPDVDNILKLSVLFDVSIDCLLRDDMRIDSRPQAETPPEKQNSRALRIAGIVFAALGALGHLVVYVISTMIRVRVPSIEQQPDGRIMFLWDGRVDYSYKYFIKEYRLGAILTILTLLIILGAAAILWTYRDVLREKLRGKFDQNPEKNLKEEN